MKGERIKQINQVMDIFQIDLRELNNGVYILCVIDETGFVTKSQFIK